MFSADRVFSQLNTETGAIEWFFSAREGIMGPYISKDYARHMLLEFEKRCREQGSDGGRSLAGNSPDLPKSPAAERDRPLSLSLEPMTKNDH
jgi:hypothetical protein